MVREKLFLFAGDQKIEHLNQDFYGKGIPDECADPEHLFKIASKGRVGVFATHLGLIEHYGPDYPEINYLVKLNGKTNLVPTKQKDPISLLLHLVEDVVKFRDQSRLDKTKLNIYGVGYTIYLGSEFESQMLSQAAQVVYQAHQHDLKTVLWIYPRGKAVSDERDPDLIAGAAGVAASLGADFVKINPPRGKTSEQRATLLKQAVAAAGRTGVICSGGERVDEKEFLQEIRDQVTIAGAAGCAVGRNIHQRTLDDAVRLCGEVAKIAL
ncbi:hypothetical protein KAT92_00870 [Candidatus Babeliales bacterium]|nr:hypothetical protein [Candidatus Babeliales bacterium]